MSEKRAFLRAASLIAAVTTLSRVLGYARDAVVAALLGATRVNDVFQIAFELVNLARRVLGEGALSAFIVPLFGAERREKGDAGGWRFASNALTAISLLGFALSLLGMLFSGALFYVFGGAGMIGEAEAFALGTSLTRIMFPYTMLLAVSALLMGLCHTLKRFAAPAFGSVMLNLAMIGTGIVFWAIHRDDFRASAPQEGGVTPLAASFGHWLAVSVLVGIVLRLLLHVPTLRAGGFRYRPRLDLKEPRLRLLFARMPMALIGLGLAQAMITINTQFATHMGAGYATFLRYSSRLTQFPLGIIAAAMATAILPQLSQFFHEGKREELRQLFGFSMRLLLVMFLPATAGLIVLGLPIVSALYERGMWTALASAETNYALRYYAFSMIPYAGLQLVIPLYYSRLDLRRPVYAGAVAVLVNLALNFFFYFGTDMKQGGLALATAISVTVNLALLVYWMRDHLRGAFDSAFFQTLWKCLAASLAMGLALYAARIALPGWAGGGRFIQRASFVAIAAPAGAAIYFGLAAALRTPDLGQALRLMRRRRDTASTPPPAPMDSGGPGAP